MQAGLPNFVMSVSEWIEKTNAIGIIVKKGRYGGTYAFKDIAFEFGTAITAVAVGGRKLSLLSMLSFIHKSFRKNAWLFGRKTVSLLHLLKTTLI